MKRGHDLRAAAAEVVGAAVGVVAKVAGEEAKVADAAVKAVPVVTGVARGEATEARDTSMPGRIQKPTALWRKGT